MAHFGALLIRLFNLLAWEFHKFCMKSESEPAGVRAMPADILSIHWEV